MAKVKSLIKLTNLNAAGLKKRELNDVAGGEFNDGSGFWERYCGCYYANCGGSSRYWNHKVNNIKQLDSALPPDGASYG